MRNPDNTSKKNFKSFFRSGGGESLVQRLLWAREILLNARPLARTDTFFHGVPELPANLN